MDRGKPKGRIAIIGGGFSGTVLAIQLARRGVASVLVESRPQFARGAAYSTREEEHLLNVPAGKMSPWPDAPSHFAERMNAKGARPTDFVSRRDYGDYLEEQLRLASLGGAIEKVSARAIAARPGADGWTVTLDDGRTFVAAGLALANGNQPPSPFAIRGLAEARRVDDPWSEAGRAAVAEVARTGQPVMLIGSGLTMVDVALTLEADGYEGAIVAVSRRGQVPHAHLASLPPPAETPELGELPHELSRLTRWLRGRAGAVGEWRRVVDSLRPVTQALWQRMDAGERARFLRHARPWWDVHRHRIAPSAAERIAAMRKRGQLTVIAGRIDGADEAGEIARISVSRRGGGAVRIEAAKVVNCTGPLTEIDRTTDPLIRQMLDEGLVTTDTLALGLAVDERDRLIGRDADRTSPAWGIGPMTKGHYWEITAAPDIRVQAEKVADDIAEATVVATLAAI